MSRVTRAAWIALLALLALLQLYVWFGPDIFYHLYLGRRVLETGQPQPTDALLVHQPSFVNTYWLFQVLIQLVFSAGGVAGVTLLLMFAWLGIVTLWARAVRILARPAIGLPLTLAAILILQNRFEPRPETFSYLFLAVQLAWLSRWSLDRPLGPRRLALWGVVQLLWTNVHGYFALGPLVVGARLVGAWLGREDRRVLRECAKLLAVSIAASFASPFGLRNWTGVIGLWSFLSEVRPFILEFGPPTGPFLTLWTVKLFWLCWGATLLAALWLLLRRRARPFGLLLLIPALYLSATSARNLPLFVLLAAPFWADLLATPGPRPRRPRLERAVSAATAAAAVGLCVWVVTGGFHASLRSETRFGLGLPPHAYPLHFEAHLAAQPFRGKVFNNAADGGYLEYRFPELRPYMDSRYTDAPILREYAAALRESAAFERLHHTHQFDGALLKVVDSPRLLIELLRAGSWTLAYADLHRAFLVPGTAPDRGEVCRFWQGEDLAQRVNGMAAIQWVMTLIELGRRDLLLQALEQFAAAEQVPSFVILYGLQIGMQQEDVEIIDRARALYPRMLALDDESRRAVRLLMGQLAARPPGR